MAMSINEKQQAHDSGRRGDGRSKRRTALIALSIALAFFAGVILKRVVLG
jgi:hypothetical protein